MSATPAAAFQLLAPPYRELLALDEDEEFPDDPRVFGGAALVWSLERGHSERHLQRISGRPGGLPLMVLLPPAGTVAGVRTKVLAVLEEARPQAILPHHPRPDVRELRLLLRSRPDDLAGEVMEYLWWRGLRLEQETRRIIRRTVDLSRELSTLTALSRGVYMSRRAIGRRFRKEGIPVPSHWLQFCRLLRATIKLQNRGDSLARVAAALGYPDGFTLSSQMMRLVGVRPSAVRSRLGWEWFLEAWLYREWTQGGLEVELNGFAGSGDVPPTHDADGAQSKVPAEGDGNGTDPKAKELAERRDSVS